jgi:glycosyltransferase involved in cell wall biosynthesis
MASVDVIVPLYNTRLDYVRAAVESVVGQSFTDWRLVLVNDGSRPECTREVEQYLAGLNEPRVQYVHQENRGLPAARNAGIRASSSDWVAFLDSDDYWYPQRLERGLAAAAANPGADVIHSRWDVLAEESGRIAPARASLRNIQSLTAPQQFRALLQSNFIGVVTTLVRRSAAFGVGLFDESLRALEDKDFWLRLMLAGSRFVHLDESLCVYRVHATSMSRDVQRMATARMKLVQKLDAAVPSNPIIDANTWRGERRGMVRHINAEIAEEYLAQKRHWHALWYSCPWLSGVSRESSARMGRIAWHLLAR